MLNTVIILAGMVLLQEMNNFDEINNFFMNNYQNKIENFVKLIWKVLMRWKNWSDFKGQESMNFREEKNQDTINELTARIQQLQMKLIVWLIREFLKMLNQYAVDIPTLPVNLCLFHLIVILEGC